MPVVQQSAEPDPEGAVPAILVLGDSPDGEGNHGGLRVVPVPGGEHRAIPEPGGAEADDGGGGFRGEQVHEHDGRGGGDAQRIQI